jgi:hypothetical protein
MVFSRLMEVRTNYIAIHYCWLLMLIAGVEDDGKVVKTLSLLDVLILLLKLIK